MLLLLLVQNLQSASNNAVISLKNGGDDVPSEEYWEKYKTQKRRDDSLDKILKEAYNKSTGKVDILAPVKLRLDLYNEEETIEMLLMGYYEH